MVVNGSLAAYEKGAAAVVEAIDPQVQTTGSADVSVPHQAKHS